MMDAILPTRTKPATARPHGAARALWGFWFCLWILTAVYQTDPLVILTSTLFLLLETAAVALRNSHPLGVTLSEVVWWDVPWGPVRWLLGVAFSLSCIVLLHPLPGGILFLWLAWHFVMTGRDYRRYDRQVKALVGAAYAHDPVNSGKPTREALEELPWTTDGMVEDALRQYTRQALADFEEHRRNGGGPGEDDGTEGWR